jgi:murein DD-endopeptidase MepM/ murein hydrolase activator NlpD
MRRRAGSRAAWAAVAAGAGLLVLLTGCAASPGDSAAFDDVTIGRVGATSTPYPATKPLAAAPGATPGGSAAARPKAAGYAFPVRAKARFSRAHHDYPAADVFAKCGSVVVAPASGTVVEVSRTDEWSSRTDDGAERGGLSFALAGADGVRYYGSHLSSIDASIVPGRAVAAGTRLGLVGNTGDARGIACHLHFGISPACGTGDWWVRRGAVSPYDVLKSWQRGQQASPVAAVTAWKAEHGCPSSPPAG